MAGTTLIDKIHEFAAQAGDTDRVLAEGTTVALQVATAAKQAADANVSNISVSGHTMTVTKGTGEGATDSTITLPDNDTQYTHPAYTARTGKPTTNQAPAFGGSVTVSQITNDATGHVTGVTDRTITIPNAEATQSSAGLMSAADKTVLDNAVATGQFNTCPYVDGATVDADTLTTPGKYYFTSGTVANHYPVVNGYIEVTKNKQNSQITQEVLTFTENGTDSVWHRVNNDTSWSGWVVEKYTVGSNVTIYISKDGSDNNDGLHADRPVLTAYRAKQIAMNISTASAIIFQFGAGDWGTVQIDASCFNAQLIDIRGTTNSDTEDTGVMPHFSTLNCWNGMYTIRSIDVDYLYFRNAYVYHTAFFKVGKLELNGSSMQIANNFAIKAVSSQTTGYVIALNRRSFLTIPSSRTISLEAGITIPVLLHLVSSSFVYFSGTTFTGTYTGKKYEFTDNPNYVATYNFNFPSALPGATAGTGNYFLNGIPQQGVVLTSGNQEIYGTKTFQSGGVSIREQMENYTNGATITSDIYQGLSVYDKNLTPFGVLHFAALTDNKRRFVFGLNSSAETGNQDGFVTLVTMPNATGSYGVRLITPLIHPSSDNYVPLGVPSNRWQEVYAGTATINTSDERVKSNIASLPDAVLDAWGEVNFQQFRFNDALAEKGDNARLHTGLIAQRILEVFQNHGLDATRYGLLCHDSWEAEDWDETIVDKEAVTETVKVVDKAAVYATRTVEISPAYTDEEGVSHPAETYEEQYEVSPEVSHEEEHVIEPEVSHVEHHHRDAGDLYSLRYEEALCVEAAYQRRRADRMEARLAALEAKLA